MGGADDPANGVAIVIGSLNVVLELEDCEDAFADRRTGESKASKSSLASSLNALTLSPDETETVGTGSLVFVNPNPAPLTRVAIISSVKLLYRRPGNRSEPSEAGAASEVPSANDCVPEYKDGKSELWRSSKSPSASTLCV